MARGDQAKLVLPSGMHTPRIVRSGAFIVFDGNSRCVASFIPGTLWPGSLALPDDFLLDNLPGTTLQPRAETTLETITIAAQQSAIWTALFGIQTRVLTALDAIGGSYQGAQHELARVCGISRERLNKRLGNMVDAGLIERTRNGSQGDRLEIPWHDRGRYWRAGKPDASALHHDHVAQERASERLMLQRERERRERARWPGIVRLENTDSVGCP
jgi:DNA-binding HxlR family transcriptional regulator